MEQILLAIITIVMTTSPAVMANLIEQLNYYAQQDQFASQVFQTPFAFENVMSTSLQLALEGCQQSFKWQRWNCPHADFFMRRNSKPQNFDREDAYVTAITTAAILYTITKNCSTGFVSDCGCSTNNPRQPCSDDPARGEELYNKHESKTVARGFADSVRKHNHKVITNLLRKSLVQQCTCQMITPAGCIDPVCWQTLRPFADIAQDIRQMYDESLQLGDVGVNTRIIWKNIPLDVLVYVKDSPNYCEPDAISGWNGMRGRQCSGDQSAATEDERMSCNELCDACGYGVRTQNLITEHHCNCQFTWSFQVQCDLCVNVEEQHYCY